MASVVLMIAGLMSVAIPTSGGIANELKAPDRSNPAPTADYTEAELSDLRVWAEQNGREFAWAQAAFRGQRSFNQLISAFESSNPDLYLDAEWVVADQPYGILRVKGSPSEAVLSELSHAPVEVRVESGYEMNAGEFRSILEDVYRSATSIVGFENVVATGYPQASTVELAVDSTVVPKLHEYAFFRPDVLRPLVSIKVTPVSGWERGQPEGILGGRGWGACTAGFSVVRGSVYGMTTANHCTSIGSTTSYQGASMALPSAPVALAASSGDVKWRRVVGDTAEPRFQSVSGGYRLVTGTANPAVGTAICKYGVSTGQTCDTVVATNVCANDYCGLSKVGNDISEAGDSGGPWFFGNTAMGIHHGTAWHGAKIVSAFTRIGAVNLLSVSVVTG